MNRKLKPYRSIVAVSAVVFIDLLAVTSAMLLAYAIRNYLLPVAFPALISGKLLAQTFDLFWWYPFAFIVFMAYEKLYHKRLPFWIEVQSVLRSCTLTLFLTIVLLYLVRIGDEISRSLVILTWAFAMLAIPLFRYYGKKLLLKLNVWSRPVIIIGNDQTIPMINGAFEREATMGYRLIGYISSSSATDCANENLPVSNPPGNLPCLGAMKDAEAIVRAAAVEDIIIADPALNSTALVEITNTIQPLVKYITLVPDLFGVSLSGLEAAYFFEEQIVLLQIKNRLRSRISSFLKRLFDLTVGLAISLLALPVVMAIVLAIKLDSTGPAFYISKRIGRNGQEFNCIKFRTMATDCDQILDQYLSADDKARQEWACYNKLISYDPRVTRVGRILRRLSLDELPQLINILRGDMSLVGPRPYLPREKEQMGSFAYDILVGKPGLTGLWQVSGRNKLTFNSRLKLDSWYMKNWSLWLDTVLLLKTVRVVMKRDGAY